MPSISLALSLSLSLIHSVRWSISRCAWHLSEPRMFDCVQTLKVVGEEVIKSTKSCVFVCVWQSDCSLILQFQANTSEDHVSPFSHLYEMRPNAQLAFSWLTERGEWALLLCSGDKHDSSSLSLPPSDSVANLSLPISDLICPSLHSEQASVAIAAESRLVDLLDEWSQLRHFSRLR